MAARRMLGAQYGTAFPPAPPVDPFAAPVDAGATKRRAQPAPDEFLNAPDQGDADPLAQLLRLLQQQTPEGQ